MPPSATEGKRVLLQAHQKLTNVLVVLAYPVSPVAVVVVVVVVTACLFTFFHYCQAFSLAGSIRIETFLSMHVQRTSWHRALPGVLNKGPSHPMAALAQGH